MNPFEEFLRKIFGAGPPPTAMEEERQAASMGQAARDLPGMARSIGKSFLDAYKQRAVDLQDLAMQQMRGTAPLSDMQQGVDPRLQQAQRDLALDVLSAGALGGVSQMGGALLSSAPGVGQSTARNALLDRLRQSTAFNPRVRSPELVESWRQYGETIPEARANLATILQERSLAPEIASAQQIPVGHSSPHFYEAPEISTRTAKTGEGNALMGPGLYVAESPEVFERYRDVVSRPGTTGAIFGGRLPLDMEALDNFTFALYRDGLGDTPYFKALMRFRDSIGNPAFIPDHLGRLAQAESLARSQAHQIKQTREELKKLKNLTFEDWLAKSGLQNFDDIPLEKKKGFFLSEKKGKEEAKKQYLEKATRHYRAAIGNVNHWAPAKNKLVYSPPEEVVATYKGVLGANPNELLQLDLPFFGMQGADLDKVLGAMKDFQGGGATGNLADSYMSRMEDLARSVPSMLPMTRNEWLSNRNESLRDRARNIANEILTLNQRVVTGELPGESRYFPSGMLNDPAEIMQAMRDQGIVGTKFADGFSRRLALVPLTDAEPITHNYTVYDPRRIQFTNAYGAANPFAPLSTTMQALRNEKEKKKK